MSEEKEESKGWRGREKKQMIVLQGNTEGNNSDNQKTPFRYKYTGFPAEN